MIDEVAPLAPLIAAPASLWTDLAAALRAGEYDERTLERTERIAPGHVDHLRLPLVQRWLEEEPGSASPLALLWSYGGALERAGAATALGQPLLNGLVKAGVLVEIENNKISSRMRLLPFEGIFALSDHLAQRGDPVMGPGRTTLRLGRWMGNVEGKSVLDVGCGAGSLALLAAKLGAKATAIDISERAIAITKINATLGSLEVDARAGDLFAPVADCKFDLIVAQPPFVIRADDVAALTFLHGGERGDELTMRLFDELPARLSPGGRALVLFQGPVQGDRPTLAQVSQRTSPHRLSLVLSVLGYLEPDAVAMVTAAETHSEFGQDYARAARGYRSALARRGIDRVVEALADLRAGEARPFSAAMQWTTEGTLSAQHLEEAWGACARIAGAPSIADVPLRLRPEAWVDSSQPLGEGETELHLRIASAPVPRQKVDTSILSLVSSLDELGTLRAALGELAPPEDVPMLLERTGPIVRDLVLNGVLILR